MTEHTPGPWTVETDQLGCKNVYAPAFRERDGGGGIFTAEGKHQGGKRVIGYTHGVSPEAEDVANAALIAATPDLLAACEAHGEVADHRRACQKCGPEHYCWTALALLQRAWQMTEPAIARAKGKQ